MRRYELRRGQLANALPLERCARNVLRHAVLHRHPDQRRPLRRLYRICQAGVQCSSGTCTEADCTVATENSYCSAGQGFCCGGSCVHFGSGDTNNCGGCGQILPGRRDLPATATSASAASVYCSITNPCPGRLFVRERRLLRDRLLRGSGRRADLRPTRRQLRPVLRGRLRLHRLRRQQLRGLRRACSCADRVLERRLHSPALHPRGSGPGVLDGHGDGILLRGELHRHHRRPGELQRVRRDLPRQHDVHQRIVRHRQLYGRPRRLSVPGGDRLRLP